jgi:hypothetical protein
LELVEPLEIMPITQPLALTPCSQPLHLLAEEKRLVMGLPTLAARVVVVGLRPLVLLLLLEVRERRTKVMPVEITLVSMTQLVAVVVLAALEVLDLAERVALEVRE